MTDFPETRSYSVIDGRTGVTIPLLVMLPDAHARTPFPLVALSHGNGGSGSIYRTLAAHLARAGFAVLLPDHPGNTRGDNNLARTVTNLERRPRHLQRVIDWAFDESPFGAALLPDVVALVGHSLGGYTALALAGGEPMPGPFDAGDQNEPVDVLPDERVKALVLLAPAAAYFSKPHALDRVRVPILMISAEHDEHTPAFHAELVARGIPDPALLEERTAAGAGHFSFLDVFPQTMRSAALPPSQDPPGFDRERFGAELGPEVAAFLRRVF